MRPADEIALLFGVIAAAAPQPHAETDVARLAIVAFPSAHIVRLANGSHFPFHSNEPDVLRELRCLAGETAAGALFGRAGRGSAGIRDSCCSGMRRIGPGS